MVRVVLKSLLCLSMSFPKQAVKLEVEIGKYVSVAYHHSSGKLFLKIIKQKKKKIKMFY